MSSFARFVLVPQPYTDTVLYYSEPGTVVSARFSVSLLHKSYEPYPQCGLDGTIDAFIGCTHEFLAVYGKDRYALASPPCNSISWLMCTLFSVAGASQEQPSAILSTSRRSCPVSTRVGFKQGTVCRCG